MLADITNADRATWALTALAGFAHKTKVADAEEAIGDLITNLLHLARAIGLDPDRVAANSLAMMETEIAEDDIGDMIAVQRDLLVHFPD